MESQNVELKLLPADNDQTNSHKDAFILGTHHPQMDHNFAVPEGKSCPLANGDSDNEEADSRSNLKAKTSIGSDGTVHALSGLYAQIIVVVAAILVFTEVLHGPIPLLFFHGYLFTYLVGGGIICFIGVYVSLLADKCPKLVNRDYDSNGETSMRSTPFMRNLLTSDVSIYLRIGAVVFGLGTLISCGLEVASMITMPKQCMDELNLAQPILRILFSFLQMHFLFMNAKEIIHALGFFRHAALMHLVATNVAIWIRLVLWESAKDWLEAIHVKHNISETWPPKEFNITLHTLESDSKSSDVFKQKPHHNVYFTTNCWWRDPEEEGFKVDLQKVEDLIELHMCLQNSTIGNIWEKAMPYLYPFIIQYSLVAAGVIYIIWSNLQAPKSKLQHLTAVSIYGEDPRDSQMNCAGSTKGLFLGLLVLVSGLIALILFFVLSEEKDFSVLFLITTLRCAIFGVSALAAILGLLQIKKMKSKTKRQRRLAELLQRTGMLAVYVYGICSLIVGGIKITSSQHHLLLFMDGLLMVIQACLQSLFIHQVSKKRLGPSNLDEKPGRQVVMFLVFCNLVLWLFESFTTQYATSDQLQKKFYGDIAWSVISRIVMPLVIFYRFHSIAALMEAWSKSYKIKQN